MQQSVMSALRRKATFLSPYRICELVWDSESYEAGAPSSSTSEDEGGFEDEQGVSHVQPDRPTSSGQASSSSFSSSVSDEEAVFQSGSGQQVQTSSPSQWTRPSGHQRGLIHNFTGGPRGKRDKRAPHINDGYSPLSVFWSYFAEIITLLVVETNRYYHDHLNRLDGGPSPLPDVTEAEMIVFLVITIQMRHCIRDKLTDYLAMTNQFYTSFYSSAMKRDRYFHIL